MAKILVAGGLWSEDTNAEMRDAREAFAAALGRELVARNHHVLGGCRTSLDAAVAKAACTEAAQRKQDPRKLIRSWVTTSTKPAHSFGEVVRSRMDDWGRVPLGFSFPEPVFEADAVIILGGWEGTHYAASWARFANKPLVPVAAFGLAAAQIFKEEMSVFDRRYAARLNIDEYQILDRLLSNLSAEAVAEFAREVVSLAERLITPRDVFVIMSFAERGQLKDAYNTFQRVCKSNDFRAFKVDHHIDPQQRIVPAIFSSIRRSAFILADVTDAKPNVYYELGYAQALGKDIIMTAAAGTPLPFDVYDVPTLFWDSQDSLERGIQARIDRFGEKFGRLSVAPFGG